MAKTKRRSVKVQKALAELDYLETILDIYEGRDFVEIIGGQGGDVDRYRVYFDKNNNISRVGVK